MSIVELSASAGVKGAMAQDTEKRAVRTYTVAEKHAAVARVKNGESKSHVGRSIGVNESTVRGWVKQLAKKSNGGIGAGPERKKATRKQRVELPAAEEKMPTAAPTPVVVQHVIQYQYSVMLLAPFATPYYCQAIPVGVPTPIVAQSQVARGASPRIAEEKVAPSPQPTPNFEDARTSMIAITRSVPKKRTRKVSSVKSASKKKRIKATLVAEAKPKVARTCPRASAPGAKSKSVGQASSTRAKVTKRKLEEPISGPEVKRAPQMMMTRGDFQQILEDERLCHMERLNHPEVAFPFADFFGALNLERRHNPGKLGSLRA